MITYVQGGFFTSPAAVLVNTVNTVGIMGKGIAKDFKAIYPEMFEIYQDACNRGDLTIGSLLFYRSEHKSVLNFPTKRSWKNKSKLSDIEAGLKTFIEQYQDLGISTIAFPQLGCGNGELDWESQVRPLMERYLALLPIDIYIHIYDGDRDFAGHRDIDVMKAWLRHEPRALGFAEVWGDLERVAVTSSTVENWDVEMVDGAALRFRQKDRTIEMPKEDVLDHWRQLRSFGLLALDDVATAYRAVAGVLLTLFEKLRYVERTEFISFEAIRSQEPVALADALSEATSRGVRLVEWSSPCVVTDQLELFGNASVA